MRLFNAESSCERIEGSDSRSHRWELAQHWIHTLGGNQLLIAIY